MTSRRGTSVVMDARAWPWPSSLGLRPAVVVPRGDVADGIQAVRSLFPRFLFDAEKCYEGSKR